jgi:hypothetical protein
MGEEENHLESYLPKMTIVIIWMHVLPLISFYTFYENDHFVHII